MNRLIRSYDLVELQRLRAELAGRGIDVYMSDEFTYAIPGLPGAEQPRALWVTKSEDIIAARRVVADLVGEHRLDPGDTTDTADSSAPITRGSSRADRGFPLFWGIILVVAVIVVGTTL